MTDEHGHAVECASRAREKPSRRGAPSSTTPAAARGQSRPTPSRGRVGELPDGPTLPVEDSGHSIDVWVLETFDPAQKLPVRFWRYSDAIRYVLGRVSAGAALTARRRKERRGWVALRWKDIAPLFGRSGRWNEIRQFLLDHRFLECDESYKVGEKAKWYRLGAALWNHKLGRAAIRDKHTASRIRKLEAVQSNRDVWTSAHHWIARWLCETTVDEKQASRWIRQRCRNLAQHLTALKIEVIQTGRANPNVDPYGRVHSAVVNLRSAVRPALRISGRPLVEVDISNSQPLLIGYIVAKVITNEWTVDEVRALGKKASEDAHFSGYYLLNAERQEKEAPGKTNTQESSREQREKRSTNCLPILHLSPLSDELPADLVDYLEVCQHGGFYQALAKAWCLPCEPGKAKNRIKELAFKYVLFGRPRPGNRFWDALRRYWPTVARVIEAIKIEDHGSVARACQRIEASLIVGGVVERFRVKYPDIPIQTIHDSVLVHSESVELAKKIIGQVFGTIGLSPNLKDKR